MAHGGGEPELKSWALDLIKLIKEDSEKYENSSRQRLYFEKDKVTFVGTDRANEWQPKIDKISIELKNYATSINSNAKNLIKYELEYDSIQNKAAHPYYVLEPHFTIEWASPKGGKAPLDPSSVENFKDDKESKEFLSDEKAKKGYENTKKLSDVNANDYVALVYVGGHGPCFDLPEDKTNIKLAEDFWKQGKIVSAVCHGPTALVNVKDANGKSIFSGRKATSFGNLEEDEIKLSDAIPFLVETRLKEFGANYQRNDKAWGAYVTVDGQLILGANSASAHEFGLAIFNALNKI